ncbi:MAG: hypothetical protein HQM09_07380 [Candidatus Riflebacteria bacterium]|nr:hypothetical protein [Candidatus Riflebacteria bacterium]
MKRFTNALGVFLLVLPLISMMPSVATCAVTATANHYFADLQGRYASVQDANILIEALREKNKRPPAVDARPIWSVLWASATPMIPSGPGMTSDEVYPDPEKESETDTHKTVKKHGKHSTKRHKHHKAASSSRHSGKHEKKTANGNSSLTDSGSPGTAKPVTPSPSVKAKKEAKPPMAPKASKAVKQTGPSNLPKVPKTVKPTKPIK